MILVLLAILLVLGVIAMIRFNVSIDLKSFFKKGLFRKVWFYSLEHSLLHIMFP